MGCGVSRPWPPAWTGHRGFSGAGHLAVDPGWIDTFWSLAVTRQPAQPGPNCTCPPACTSRTGRISVGESGSPFAVLVAVARPSRGRSRTGSPVLLKRDEGQSVAHYLQPLRCNSFAVDQQLIGAGESAEAVTLGDDRVCDVRRQIKLTC